MNDLSPDSRLTQPPLTQPPLTQPQATAFDPAPLSLGGGWQRVGGNRPRANAPRLDCAQIYLSEHVIQPILFVPKHFLPTARRIDYYTNEAGLIAIHPHDFDKYTVQAQASRVLFRISFPRKVFDLLGWGHGRHDIPVIAGGDYVVLNTKAVAP